MPSFSPYLSSFSSVVHLLDLKATSSWKTGPLTLFQVSVDSGELDRLPESTFTPKTRTLESEKILREQLFRRTQSEEEENEQILDGTSDSMSTNLFGGAGVSRVLLMLAYLGNFWFAYVPKFCLFSAMRIHVDICSTTQSLLLSFSNTFYHLFTLDGQNNAVDAEGSVRLCPS